MSSRHIFAVVSGGGERSRGIAKSTLGEDGGERNGLDHFGAESCNSCNSSSSESEDKSVGIGGGANPSIGGGSR